MPKITKTLKVTSYPENSRLPKLLILQGEFTSETHAVEFAAEYQVYLEGLYVGSKDYRFAPTVQVRPKTAHISRMTPVLQIPSDMINSKIRFSRELTN